MRSWTPPPHDAYTLNDDPGEVPEGMPPARRARQLGETGDGEVVFDFGDEIDEVVRDRYSGDGAGDDEAPPEEAVPHSASGGGCSIAGGASSLCAWPAPLALLLMALRRRSPRH